MNPLIIFQIADYIKEEVNATSEKHMNRYHALVDDIFFGGIEHSTVTEIYIDSLLKVARRHIKEGDMFNGRLFIRVALNNAFAL